MYLIHPKLIKMSFKWKYLLFLQHCTIGYNSIYVTLWIVCVVVYLSIFPNWLWLISQIYSVETITVCWAWIIIISLLHKLLCGWVIFCSFFLNEIVVLSLSFYLTEGRRSTHNHCHCDILIQEIVDISIIYLLHSLIFLFLLYKLLW